RTLHRRKHFRQPPQFGFNLARRFASRDQLREMLDQQERPAEALDCWRNFLQLAPRSPWADEARERLGLGRIEADDPELEFPVD
ncbi:MAG: hypothetical protein ACKO9H_18780, partial [Planctomycetota bacterium]